MDMLGVLKGLRIKSEPGTWSLGTQSRPAETIRRYFKPRFFFRVSKRVKQQIFFLSFFPFIHLYLSLFIFHIHHPPMPVPFLSGNHQLSIELAEPVVILRGQSTDPTTAVVRGEVELLLSKPILASSIVVKLVGKSHMLWPEGNNGTNDQ
jgi:hypothetical protein